MDMLRAMEILKKDLKGRNKYNNRLYLESEILNTYTDYEGIPKGRIIQFYGHPDCGKTMIAKSIIRDNPRNTFIYISANKDDISKISYANTAVLMSNIFEDTISYLDRVKKGDVDAVFIDNINNMLSKEELLSAFTKQLDNRDILNKYMKKISLLAAQKGFAVIIFNGINLITNKSRYSYIIEKEAVANFEVKKLNVTKDYVTIEICPQRNLMSKNTLENRFRLSFIDRWNYYPRR